MKDDLIKSVAATLLEWNPLGEQAKSIKDLEGYKYEAMDIISAVEITKISTKRAVSDVLTQAFNIDLDEKKLLNYSAKIERHLNSSK